MPHVIARGDGPRRRVVVIGGGPAGLEAARVSAARGHEVVLLEATDRLGGQVNLAARLDRRREILGITGWLQREVELAGVDVRLNSYAEADDVLALAPDIVVVATGGTPNTGFFGEGADLVASGWDVLSGQTALSGEVLVYDENGQHQGPSVAEYLAARGRQGDLRGARPDAGGRAGGHQLGAVHEGALRGWRPASCRTWRCKACGARATGSWPPCGTCTPSAARSWPPTTSWSSTARCRRTSSTTRSRPARATMARSTWMPCWPAGRRGSTPTRPARYQLFRVGDAVASRNIHAAIYDSLRLCKNF